MGDVFVKLLIGKLWIKKTFVHDCTTGLTGYALDGTKCKCAADYAAKDGKCVKCVDNDANSKPNADGTACECKTDYSHNGTSCVQCKAGDLKCQCKTGFSGA